MHTPTPKPGLFQKGLFGLLAAKTLLHLTAILNGYGLHRDEYLYLAEGHHPLWGYMEGPPVIGWVAGISQLIFGGTIWAAKIPVLIIGLLSLWLLCEMVRELGGGKHAQLIAGAGWLLSPVYLGSNALFQPVSFNQFCWLLTGLALVRLINYQRPKDWYILGGVAGLGLMTKYSIVFYLFSLLAGLLLTEQRSLLRSKHLWRSVGIALVMWLPNLWWQFNHGFPVMAHMQELSETQLVNMSAMDFLVPQFLFHALGVLIWLPGLVYLIRSKQLRPYRSLAFAYIILIALLLLLNGKAYYTFGAYTSLFAAGGCYWAQRLGEKSWWVVLPLAANFILIPFGLPVLPVDKMQQYSIFTRDNLGMTAGLRWEDGTVRDLSQDYADMHGWEEMVAKVAEFYHQLPPEEQATCMIEGGNYGHAGALSFFRHKYDLPEAVSFDASFLLWVPEQVEFDRQIILDDSPQGPSDYFSVVSLIDSTHTPYARETGFIYYRKQPKTDVSQAWTDIVRARRAAQLGE
ncbi:glycosyltransferase family 39 protein [Neolewinella aurantiaca]|uniref:Glycosyltransferase family 39 protein n=1 Tax=Neolewinella aurantiaca TaxID=2602767 RepID=A0A5C7FF96_9BACT|nr:glycosyltransferase family 39 protein [Neolewinella aurantiaca]TXF88237.1 glycosyltransferase family 39 protein [Neolewinella aurantiaca]